MAGFGCSGSSLVVDWAGRFSDCHVFPGEFDLFRRTDGVLDLRRTLTSQPGIFSANVALRRFGKFVSMMARPHDLAFGRDVEAVTYPGFEAHLHAFLDGLIALRHPAPKTADWIMQHSEADPPGRSRLFQRARSTSEPKRTIARMVLRLRGLPLPERETEIWIPRVLSAEEFDDYARPFLDDMAARIAREKGFLVLDQAFMPSNVEDGLNLFSDGLGIVVHRDPRDVFMSGLKADRDWLPTGSAEDFAAWFKIAVPKIALNDARIFVIGFEDLVTAPDRAFAALGEFTGLDAGVEHLQTARELAAQSQGNVGKWKAHPDQKLIAKVHDLCADHYQAIVSHNTTLQGRGA